MKEIITSWVTQHPTSDALSSLSVKVPLDSYLRVLELVSEKRGYKTFNIGLLTEDDLIKIRDVINDYLRKPTK